MKEVKTSTGFKCKVNENVVKDWRFIKALSLMNSADEMDIVTGATQTVTLLLGAKGEQELCRHVEQDGVAPVEDIMREIKEIIEKLEKK